MYTKISKWLKGYVRINISGEARNRFVNICANKNIRMWKLSEKDDCIYTYMSWKDYKAASEYIDKTRVVVTIMDELGFPSCVKRYKSRYGFMIGFFAFFALIYGFTNFVWDINVTGEGVYTEEEIIKCIRENYVDIGTPKEKISCDKLEKELRQRYDKLAWISCEIKGTRLNVKLTETLEKDTINKLDTPCNLIAAKDGIVTKVVTRSGKAVSDIGVEVKKGDILITGVINVYNDYDELIETNYVPSDGEVYAIVKTEYYDQFALDIYEKKYTGEEKKRLSLILGEKTFTPVKYNDEYSLCDIIYDEKKLKLGTAVYFPASLNVITIKEYETKPVKLNIENAEEKASKRLNYHISELQKKGVEILENNVTISIDEDQCIAKGIIITRELISIPSELTIIEQGELP